MCFFFLSGVPSATYPFKFIIKCSLRTHQKPLKTILQREKKRKNKSVLKNDNQIKKKGKELTLIYFDNIFMSLFQVNLKKSNEKSDMTKQNTYIEIE